jgi:hypothetical protein
VAHSVVAGDPSLRLKNGYAQDDAIDERGCHRKFKMSHCETCSVLVYPTEGRSSTFFVVIATCVDSNFGRG